MMNHSDELPASHISDPVALRLLLRDSYIYNQRIEEELEDLRTARLRRFSNEECWIYQEGEDNHLGSLVCPVVISAGNFRRAVREQAQFAMEKRSSRAATDVLAERQRQIDVEGWTAEHDDGYDSGELAGAASCYAAHVNGRQWVFPNSPDDYQAEPTPDYWPWDADWWKPKSPRQDLVRAAALLLAEIERLDRAAAAAES